ncbi:coiled-coil domain-containing protein 177 [Solea solea]|uniref:coiled-coil domain-containing protein 177 n=1 Tax=Solea solea TaxID=90069 RepID=UPI00272A00BD|nr:coiled-coil domain-containing protein 177 [Solea solea]
MEQRSTSSALHLDLNNFDKPEAQRNRYVLTSPRSLQSCARLGIKPVDLLIKSLNELTVGHNDVPLEAVRVMHESYEKERRRLLQMCREERERIIQGNRWPGSDRVSGLEVVPLTKLKDHSVHTQSIPYAELCSKGKSVSRSTTSNREPDHSTVCSFRLGNRRHSPATERKVERFTNDIQREMCVTVSERDRKIAALMLVKHEEEQARLKLCRQEEHEREEARRQREIQREQAENNRRKKLKQSMQRWQEELEARRRLREHQNKEKAGHMEQEVMLQEDRWRRLKEEVEAQHRVKLKAAQKEADQRKHYQEKLLREKQEAEKWEQEQERLLAVEREEKARRSKELKKMNERRRLQEENHRELLRHILLKQQIKQQVEEEEAQVRSTLEKKLQHTCEKRTHAVEARMKELHERAAQEEVQVQRAQLRSKLHSVQQLTHKQILLQLSQRRMEKAALRSSARLRRRAQQLQQRNKQRQLCHQRLRERIQREEEATRKIRESCISMKEWRRERLRRQRDQILLEGQMLARASFHMRERVRQHTHSQTFHQMALQAQLTASMSHMKL